jgi:glucokinase
MNGHLWRGADGSAGEIGYLFIDSKAAMNGQNGSLESYCNSKALLDRARRRMPDGLTPVFDKILSGEIESLTVKRLFQAARSEDQVALDAIEETVQHLGIGLAGAVNLLNPEIVVIGGGIADGGLDFIDQVEAVIKKYAFDSATRNLKVVKASLGNAAGFIGASVLGEDS